MLIDLASCLVGSAVILPSYEFHPQSHVTHCGFSVWVENRKEISWPRWFWIELWFNVMNVSRVMRFVAVRQYIVDALADRLVHVLRTRFTIPWHCIPAFEFRKLSERCKWLRLTHQHFYVDLYADSWRIRIQIYTFLKTLSMYMYMYTAS